MAWPLIGINVLGVLALLVDTLMCARLENAELALTALGYATQIVFLLMMGSIGLNVGVVALVARAHGAGDTSRANHVVAQGTWLAVGVGLLTATLGTSMAGPILSLLGASGAAQAEALRYLEPMLMGSVCTYLAFLYMSVLRGIGNTRLPLMVSLLVNLLNFVFNYGLILGNLGLPKLGVQGAAIGTLLAYGIGAVVYMLMIQGRNTGRTLNVQGIHVSMRLDRLDAPLVKEIARVGLPAALDMMVLNIGFMAVIGMLARIDEMAVAAHSIGLRIQGLAFVPGFAISMASAPLIGQALGAGDVPQARAVTKEALRQCLTVMTCLGLLFVCFDGFMVRSFEIPEDTALFEYSTMWIQVLGYCMPIFGVHIAFVGTFHGSGSTWLALSLNMVGTLCVQIPAAYLLGFTFGLGPLGVWLAFPVGFSVRAALESWAFSGSRWTRTGVHV